MKLTQEKKRQAFTFVLGFADIQGSKKEGAKRKGIKKKQIWPTGIEPVTV